MKKTKLLISGTIIVSLLIGTTVFASSSTPGSNNDPLVTKSYVDTQISNNLGTGNGGSSVDAAKITTLEIQLNSANSKIANLETQLNTANGRVNTLQTQVNTLQTQLNTANTKVSNLETSNNTANTKITAIENQLKNLESRVNNMSSTPTPATPAPTPAPTLKTGTVNTASLNVRKGPGTTFDRVGTLANGTTVTILKSQAVSGVTWHEVRSGTIQGWVHGAYISNIK